MGRLFRAGREIGPISPPDAESHDGERYELLDELATGGMAAVYLGRLRRPMGFSRLVAIKCMHPQYAKDPRSRRCYWTRHVSPPVWGHPNIDSHARYRRRWRNPPASSIMEYVEDEVARGASSARSRCQRPHPRVAVACAIIHDLLLGLHEAHEDYGRRRRRARDHSSRRLAAETSWSAWTDGLARVLDFRDRQGAEPRPHTATKAGSRQIPYMPPEQLFGEALDHRVDIMPRPASCSGSRS